SLLALARVSPARAAPLRLRRAGRRVVRRARLPRGGGDRAGRDRAALARSGGGRQWALSLLPVPARVSADLVPLVAAAAGSVCRRGLAAGAARLPGRVGPLLRGAHSLQLRSVAAGRRAQGARRRAHRPHSPDGGAASCPARMSATSGANAPRG